MSSARRSTVGRLRRQVRAEERHLLGVPRNMVFADKMAESVPWLRAHLEAKGRALAPSTPLGRALDRLEQFESRRYKPTLRRGTLRQVFLEIAGADVLTHVLREGHGGLGATFDGHWPLLTKGDVLPTVPAAGSMARNRVWELFVGALCTQFATDVRAEEPDVRCEFLGQRVGVACKCLYSTKEHGHAQRIVEAAKQIEAADVDLGFVLVNVVNLLPRRELLDPRRVTDLDLRDPMGVVNRKALELFERLPLDELWERMSGEARAPRTKTRAVVLFAPALTPTDGHGPTLSMPFTPLFFRMVAADIELRFVDALGNALAAAIRRPAQAPP